jgi:hypothetical protein
MATEHALPVENEDNAVAVTSAKTTPLWKGHLNIWFFLITVLLLWFFFARGFPLYGQIHTIRPPMGFSFGLHLTTCIIVSFACIWNIFHQPSDGPLYRKIHVWLGRVGLIAGFISVFFGYLTVWWERYNPNTTGFNIGISIGGALQVIFQVVGYLAIKKWNVARHSSAMQVVFFGGCCIPAMMRVPELIGADLGVWTTYSWIFPLVLLFLSVKASKRNSWY